jgi:hypothetical protein
MNNNILLLLVAVVVAVATTTNPAAYGQNLAAYFDLTEEQEQAIVADLIEKLQAYANDTRMETPYLYLTDEGRMTISYDNSTRVTIADDIDAYFPHYTQLKTATYTEMDKFTNPTELNYSNKIQKDREFNLPKNHFLGLAHVEMSRQSFFYPYVF